jgi:hypothetical protein
MATSLVRKQSAHSPVEEIGPKRGEAEHGGKNALTQYKEIRIILKQHERTTAGVTHCQKELGTEFQIADPPATNEQDES